MLGLSPSNVVKSFTLTMNDYVVPEKSKLGRKEDEDLEPGLTQELD